MKPLRYPLFFALLFNLMYAQPGLNRLWEKELTNTAGIKIMEFNAVLSDSVSTLVGGHSSTQAGIVMYLSSYQPNGQLAWDTTLMTPNFSSVEHLGQDGQGNWYAVGTEIIGNFHERQVHLVKMNSSGQLLWRTTYRGPGNLFARTHDFQVVNDQLYLCGSEKQDQSYEIGWVASFDLDGNLLWENSIDPGTSTSLTDMDIDAAGTVTATGTADYEYSFLMLQYQSNGTLNWQYPDTLSGDAEAYLSDVVSDEQGNVYAIGAKEVGSFAEYDLYTLKLNNSGALLWEATFSTGYENASREIRLGPDGTIYSFGNKEISFDQFALILAYDSAGNELWQTDYDLDESTSIVAVELDETGNLYLGVADYYSVGFAKFSPNGTLLETQTYPEEEIQYLYDISLSSLGFVGIGSPEVGDDAILVSLDPGNLNEDFLQEIQGQPLSDARPGQLTSDGSSLWLATYADDGDTGRFAITKLDVSGNVLWEYASNYPSAFPDFSYLTHDGGGNVIGFFQNGTSVSTGTCGLIKLNASGMEEFTVLLDSVDAYQAGGLTVSDTGDIYLSGFNSASKQMFVSRYSSLGVEQWTKFYQSPSPDFPFAKPYEMQLSPQGKIILAAIHKDASNDSDLHLFQYANDGTLEWHQDVADQSGSLTDFAGMEIATNGEITIFGSSGIGYYVAARFDSGGGLLWEDQGFNPPSRAPRSMAVDDQGRVYLCFSTNSHVYLRLLSAAGVLLAEEQLSLPSSGSFFFPWRCSMVNNQLAILGEHLTLGAGVPFEMLVNDQLEMVYGKIDSSRRAKIEALTVDPAGNLYAAYVTGDLSLGQGYRGSLLRKFAVGTVGIDNLWETVQGVRVYPNPAREILNIDVSQHPGGKLAFWLYDLQGRVITELSGQQPSGTEAYAWTIPAQLGNGMYLLGIQSEQGTVFQKLLIER